MYIFIPMPSAVLPLHYGVHEPGRENRPGPDAQFRPTGGGGRRIFRMSHQPESTSTSLAASPAPEAAPMDGTNSSNAGGSQPPAPHVPRWLVRFELVLRVMLRMYIGLAICYAPWSPMFWDQNPLFLQFPTLSAIAGNGAVRGLVSGLGLLNLWIAFQDAVHYRDQ